MDNLVIKILGVGGCINNGLSHHAFLINRHFLAEAPPDVMVSLQKHRVDWRAIDQIYISHLHGDHSFGIPFLIINKWAAALDDSRVSGIRVMGPAGTREMVQNLTAMAFTGEHPCYHWMLRNVAFEEIAPNSVLELDGLTMTFFPLQHPTPTLGMLLGSGEKPLLAYIADTIWCTEVERVLELGSRAVLMDMNGGAVHISHQEAMVKAKALISPHTQVYGTHLYKEFASQDDQFTCAHPGDEIRLAF